MIRIFIPYDSGNLGHKHIVIDNKVSRMLHPEGPDIFKYTLVENALEKRH